ncbi:MAG TPA: ABC transporter ATP-binding protein [Candidatus Azosocius sp. HAIN]
MKAIEIIKLNKIYNKNFLALCNININVEIGDFFALLGPNGAGKSTIIGILTSLIKKTSGKIFFFGYDFDYSINIIKKFVGFVPQEFNFNYFETILEIIINQAGYYGITKKKALNIAEYYLNKLDLWKYKNTISRNLSGGMRRKLMIIRALIHNPKILILDEPTAGIDIELRYFIWNFLSDLNKSGVTIILTTHYLEEAEFLCNKISIINKGEIVLNTLLEDLIFNFKKKTLICEVLEEIINLPISDRFKIYKIKEKVLEIILLKKSTFNDLFNFFNEKNINIINIKNKTSYLEELFINTINKNNKGFYL